MARGKHSKKKTVVSADVQTSVVETVAPVAAVVAPPKVEAAPSRKPVVTREAIARRAFELFRARGGLHGHAMRDWLQAEAELGLGKQ